MPQGYGLAGITSPLCFLQGKTARENLGTVDRKGQLHARRSVVIAEIQTVVKTSGIRLIPMQSSLYSH